MRAVGPILALLLVALSVGLLLLPGAVPAARGVTVDNTTNPVTGAITGPSQIGLALTQVYEVSATGGPAEATNGTQVGTYAYKASIAALNATGASITPTSGVLVNGSVNLSLIAPNVTEELTIFVNVTSSFAGTNASTNLTYTVSVVQPFRLLATIVVGSTSSVTAFALTVTLDGQPVGSVNVPSLSAGQSYPIVFSYVVPGGLSAGWHTFGISLAKEHGLVTFAGGTSAYSSSFYVPGPPPDYTVWYLTGAAAFLGALVIWSMAVGARRRSRTKK